MKSSLLRLGHIYIVSNGKEKFEAQYQCPDSSNLEPSEHLFRRTDNGQLIKVHQDNIISEEEHPWNPQ